jgi:hypothetical protein
MSACLRRRKTGVFPYIVAPLKSGDKLLPYAILGELTLGATRRRAWFLPPVAGDTVLVQLETMAQNLGCTGEAPPCGKLETPYVGLGDAVPKNTPVLLQLTNAISGAQLYMGCDEAAGGVLRYSSPPACGAASPTWLQLTNANALHPNLAFGIDNRATTSDGRALYAQPTISSDVFQLAWQAPATAAGTPCQLLLVYPCDCPPCGVGQLGAAPPGSVVAGPTWPGM